MARRVGRYELHEPIASGGMAVVHLGRIVGPIGFARTVAIKRLHPHLATDPEFVAMFLDEARLAARVQHPNVVATLDVVASEGELFLVMDYVLGASLSQLLKGARVENSATPPGVISSIVAGTLYGLHAAHEARDERGELLSIVHRDVSPQNVLVGVDGVARVVDFGVAKAASRVQSTRDGQIKGKLAYMSREQILRGQVDRRADVYAAGVVLWEALAGRRLFVADDVGAVAAMVLEGTFLPLTSLRDDVPSEIDEVIERALAREPEARFATALEFTTALEAALPPAAQHEVGAWVSHIARHEIDGRRQRVFTVEQTLTEGNDDQVVEGLLAGPTTPEDARALATAVTATLSGDGMGPTQQWRPSDAPAAPDVSDVAPGRRRRRWIVGALVGALVVGGAYGARGLRGAPTLAAPASSSPTVDAPPLDESAGAPAGGAGEPAMPATGAPPSGASHRIPPHSRPVVHSHTTPAPPAATATPVPGCDPAFTLDPNGVKRFKPWCL